MTRFLTPERIYDEIIPLHLEPMPDGGLETPEMDAALMAHVDEMRELIDEMEAEVRDRAGPEPRAMEQACRNFDRDLLVAAKRLISQENVFISNTGLRLAALAVQRGLDPAHAVHAFDEFDRHVFLELETLDELVRKLSSPSAADLFVPGANIFLPFAYEDEKPRPRNPEAGPPPAPVADLYALAMVEAMKPQKEKKAETLFDALEQSINYKTALAHGLISAASLLPPRTELGDRLHEQTVVAIQQASANGLEIFQGLLTEYAAMCRFPDFYPGACEIWTHAYDLLLTATRDFIDTELAKPQPADLSYLAQRLMVIDSIVLGYFPEPRMQGLAAEAFPEHMRLLERFDSEVLPYLLPRILQPFHAEEENEAAIPQGVERLVDLIEKHAPRDADGAFYKAARPEPDDFHGAQHHIAQLH